MSNHEQIIMAMTAAESIAPSTTAEVHQVDHVHNHEHSEANEHATPQNLTIRQKIGNWAISKSGIMQNQHVENITAATCCGAVCRADVPVVAAYVEIGRAHV